MFVTDRQTGRQSQRQKIIRLLARRGDQHMMSLKTVGTRNSLRVRMQNNKYDTDKALGIFRKSDKKNLCSDWGPYCSSDQKSNLFFFW